MEMRNGIEIPKHYCLYILMIGMQIFNIKRDNLIHKVYQNQPLPTKIT